jgi:hypothetical protein
LRLPPSHRLTVARRRPSQGAVRLMQPCCNGTIAPTAPCCNGTIAATAPCCNGTIAATAAACSRIPHRTIASEVMQGEREGARCSPAARGKRGGVGSGAGSGPKSQPRGCRHACEYCSSTFLYSLDRTTLVNEGKAPHGRHLRRLEIALRHVGPLGERLGCDGALDALARDLPHPFVAAEVPPRVPQSV